jgi:hypothetical protein
VEFDWDPAKSEATFRVRGFDFAYASRIFQAGFIESKDNRDVGQVGPDVLVVIYTRRGAALRIIWARRANRKERAQWQSRG